MTPCFMFGPAWFAYGHSFAVENEHVQVMSAYYNTHLAEKFFSLALDVASNDPIVVHGVKV